MNEALLIQKSQSGGELIYWNAKGYKCQQQGD
jgi:hypothetical protein